jgi:signal transduction histidine kinase
MEHKTNPLADKARSYTVSPREDAWDKIHDRLQKKKTPPRKKLDMTIIIIVAIAVLGIAIIIGLLQIMHMVDHKE